jgi:N-acetylglucosamine-6-sulfatase
MMKGGWVTAHQKQIEAAKGRKVRVAIIGDSLVAGWSKDSWTKVWAPRDACNFGIPADRTEHVQWRLSHGILDTINPDVVLLQIGTNDLKSGEIRRSPEDTVKAIKTIVQTIRDAKPKARIIVMGIFPRQPKYEWIDAVIQETNVRLAQLQREMTDVLVVDIGIQFRGPNLLPNKVHLVDDMLHLKASGYEMWTQCVVDMVDAALARSSAK